VSDPAQDAGPATVPTTPHRLDRDIGTDEEARRVSYRELFRGALGDPRLALNQINPSAMTAPIGRPRP
jgi:hypothetical protein